MTLQLFLEVLDGRGPVRNRAMGTLPCGADMAIVRGCGGALPPLVRGVQTGTAGRALSSVPGVVEAAE
jgi:hypothetical protein